MAEVLLPGQIHRQSEFISGLTGACGPNALAMGRAWALQQSAADTYTVYTDMYRRGLCAANGASTIDALRQEAVALGLPITGYRGYGEPWAAADWRAWYTAFVGHNYILMETANGQALRDSISGRGENAVNLHYHFIGVVGHHDGGFSARAGRDLPAGWWCCDGDNFAAGDVLQFYPDGVLGDAKPCGALAFGAKVSISMTGVPAGWKDAGGVLTAPNGLSVQHGFRTHILAAPSWPAALVPVSGEYGSPPHQDFTLSLVWIGNAANEVAGPNYPAEIASLQAQLAAAQKQPQSANPVADKALVFMQELKELLPQV